MLKSLKSTFTNIAAFVTVGSLGLNVIASGMIFYIGHCSGSTFLTILGIGSFLNILINLRTISK